MTAPALGTVPEPMKPYDAEAPVDSEPFQSRFFTVRELPEPEEDPFQSWATEPPLGRVSAVDQPLIAAPAVTVTVAW